jgi:hypothetical protein
MSWKRGILLALLAAALGLYILKVEIPEQEQKAAAAKPLASWNKQDIRKVSITRPGESFALVNGRPGIEPGLPGPEWVLEGVTGADLDPSAVTSLLDAVTGLETKDPLPAAELASDLSVYGLAQPAVSMTVAGLQDVTIDFGKRSDYLGKRYLRVHGLGAPSIYLMPEDLYRTVDKTPSQWRKKMPVDVREGDLNRITFQNGSTRVVLEAVAEGSREVAGITQSRWKLVEPIAVEANDETIAEVIRQLRNLKVKEFYDGKVLESPEAGFRLEFKADLKREPLEIQLAKRETSEKDIKAVFTVSTKPTLFGSEQDPLPDLIKTPRQLREDKVFRLAVDRVQRFELTSDGKAALAFEKSGEKWSVNGKPTKADAVDGFLDTVFRLKAAYFPTNLPESALQNSRLKLTFHLAARDTEPAVDVPLTIGEETGKTPEGASAGYYASGADTKTPFAIDAATLQKLDMNEDFFVEQSPPE